MEAKGENALRLGKYKTGNTTLKSPHLARDFVWIVSAHVTFSLRSFCHMSRPRETRHSLSDLDRIHHTIRVASDNRQFFTRERP